MFTSSASLSNILSCKHRSNFIFLTDHKSSNCSLPSCNCCSTPTSNFIQLFISIKNVFVTNVFEEHFGLHFYYFPAHARQKWKTQKVSKGKIIQQMEPL